jgi:hypothetical protein
VGSGVGLGVGAAMILTKVLSVSATITPSSSVPDAAAMLLKISPGFPTAVSVNVQLYLLEGPD